MQATEGSKIREATQEDLFELLLLGYEFTKEGPDHLKPFEKDVVETVFANAIDDENYLVLVLDVNGSIEGMLLAACVAPWMLSKTFAVELAWFVRKTSRDGRSAIKMVKAYEAWAKSKGIKKVCMSDLTDIQGLGKLYNRLGYSLTETSYIKEV